MSTFSEEFPPGKNASFARHAGIFSKKGVGGILAPFKSVQITLINQLKPIGFMIGSIRFSFPAPIQLQCSSKVRGTFSQLGEAFMGPISL